MFSSGLVNIYTADIEAAVAFYGATLGLTETFRTPAHGAPAHVEFAAGGFTIGLGTVEAARAAHGVDPAPGSPAFALVLWCADVDATVGALDPSVPSAQPAHDTGNGNRAALIHDPDGTLIELVSKTGA